MKIPDPRFVLHTPIKEISMIMMIVRSGGTTIKISTGMSILCSSWNAQAQRVENGNGQDNFREVNYELERLRILVKDTFIQGVSSGKLTREYLKSAIIEKYRVKLNKSNSLLAYIEEYITGMELGRRLSPSGSRYKQATINNYIQTKSRMKDFLLSTRVPSSLDAISMGFYSQLLDWMRGNGMANNTIAKHVKNLKAILNSANDDGVQVNMAFKSRKFRNTWENVDSIYLSEQELNRIRNLQLDSRMLIHARDLFLIGCYTGLRFSDLSKVDLTSIVKIGNGSMLRIHTQKTGAIVTIPVKPLVMDIISRYNGFPMAMSNQKLNRCIKMVAELAELKDLVKVVRTEGGRATTHTFPKWQLVSTHTARRSFATNLYLSGVPSHSIMKVTGHSTEKSFLRYLKISGEENANLLVNSDFFK